MGNPYAALKPLTSQPMTLSERVIKRCQRDNDSGCLVWQGMTTGPSNGSFGILRVKGETFRVHRIAFENAVRKLEEGEQVGHTCRNNRCCEPKHLFAF